MQAFFLERKKVGVANDIPHERTCDKKIEKPAQEHDAPKPARRLLCKMLKENEKQISR